MASSAWISSSCCPDSSSIGRTKADSGLRQRSGATAWRAHDASTFPISRSASRWRSLIPSFRRWNRIPGLGAARSPFCPWAAPRSGRRGRCSMRCCSTHSSPSLSRRASPGRWSAPGRPSSSCSASGTPAPGIHSSQWSISISSWECSPPRRPAGGYRPASRGWPPRPRSPRSISHSARQLPQFSSASPSPWLCLRRSGSKSGAQYPSRHGSAGSAALPIPSISSTCPQSPFARDCSRERAGPRFSSPRPQCRFSPAPPTTYGSSVLRWPACARR